MRFEVTANIPIGVKRYTAGVADAHNNVKAGWAAPETVLVFGIAPVSSDEPFEAGRNAVVTGLSVLAPVGTVIGSKDRVVIDSEEYTVDGDLADWSRGPFGFEAGIEFKLKKVDG